jgi:hypothetical protein
MNVKESVKIWFGNVLHCPTTNSRSMCYNRRLSLYKLTVINMGIKCMECYMWKSGAQSKLRHVCLNFLQKWKLERK